MNRVAGFTPIAASRERAAALNAKKADSHETPLQGIRGCYERGYERLIKGWMKAVISLAFLQISRGRDVGGSIGFIPVQGELLR